MAIKTSDFAHLKRQTSKWPRFSHYAFQGQIFVAAASFDELYLAFQHFRVGSVFSLTRCRVAADGARLTLECIIGALGASSKQPSLHQF
jgi:hypothetical protein